MTLKEFISFYSDSSRLHHRVSLWESEVCIGNWCGLFPIAKIPEEYQNREVVKFAMCEEDDEDAYNDPRPCMWVVVK